MPHIERLEQLRRVVLAAPDNELFDMNVVEGYGDCGPPHCALGWAMVDSWFKENCPISATDYFDTNLGIFDLNIDDFDSLFDAPVWDMQGGRAKTLVIANIDRIIRGEPAIPYYDQGRWARELIL